MRNVSIVCDFCGKELGNHWETTMNKLSISLTQSCCNPLEDFDPGNFQECKVQYNDICFHCIRELSNGITRLLKQTGKDKNKHSNGEIK